MRKLLIHLTIEIDTLSKKRWGQSKIITRKDFSDNTMIKTQNNKTPHN